jgi:hypothetical protein
VNHALFSSHVMPGELHWLICICRTLARWPPHHSTLTAAPRLRLEEWRIKSAIRSAVLKRSLAVRQSDVSARSAGRLPIAKGNAAGEATFLIYVETAREYLADLASALSTVGTPLCFVSPVRSVRASLERRTNTPARMSSVLGARSSYKFLPPYEGPRSQPQ